MRPTPIRRFSWVYISSLIYGLVFCFVAYGSVRAWSLAQGKAAATTLVWELATTAVGIALWFLITRRASKIAKWILTISAILGAVMVPLSWFVLQKIGQFYTWGTVVSAVWRLIAIQFLFHRDAKKWFDDGPNLWRSISATFD